MKKTMRSRAKSRRTMNREDVSISLNTKQISSSQKLFYLRSIIIIIVIIMRQNLCFEMSYGHISRTQQGLD